MKSALHENLSALRKSQRFKKVQRFLKISALLTVWLNKVPRWLVLSLFLLVVLLL
jgi:hypothetical protein